MTDKLNGINPGDRVRGEFEGTYVDGTRFELDDVTGQKGSTWFAPSEINAPTFQITRIEPELAVGDMVTWGTGERAYEIVYIRCGVAVLYNPLLHGPFQTESQTISSLRRVPAK